VDYRLMLMEILHEWTSSAPSYLHWACSKSMLPWAKPWAATSPG